MIVLGLKYKKLLSFLLLFAIVLAITPMFLVSTFSQLDSIELEAEFSLDEEASLSKPSSDNDLCFETLCFHYRIKDGFFDSYNSSNIIVSTPDKFNNPHSDLLLPPPKQA